LEEKAEITVITNTNKAEDGQRIVQLINNVDKNYTLQKSDLKSSFSISQETVQGRTGKYIDFVLPGIIGFSILSTAIAGTALVLCL
jgi:hypothetical protein